MDRGAWQTVVHEVAKSWAQLSDEALHSTAFSVQTGSGWIPWLKGKGRDGKEDRFFLLRIDSFSSNNPPFYFEGSQFKFIPGGPVAAPPTFPAFREGHTSSPGHWLLISCSYYWG